MTYITIPPDAKYSEKSKNHFLHFEVYTSVIDGAPPVTRLTVQRESTLTQSISWTRAVKISPDALVSVIGTNSTNTSVMVKVSSTPRMNMASCTSVMSVLKTQLLHFWLRLAEKIWQKIRNPVCNCVSCQAVICKSLKFFRTHNLCSLQHECLQKIHPHYMVLKPGQFH